MQKTLVVRACAVGDFIFNLPALRALQELHPGAQFTLAGYPATLDIARDFISVEAILSLDSGKWSRLYQEPLRDLQFDSAIVWMKTSVVADNLRLSGIPSVFRADPFPSHGHAAAHLLRTLGLPSPPLPDLWTPSSGLVVVHPGSGSAKKNWPFFKDVIPELPNAFVLRGPAEGAENVMPLREISRMLRQARAYIGNDSGITHLAAYLGVPTIALFGPTDPRVWGPIGRRSRIIWKERLSDIAVGDVLNLLSSGGGF